MCDRPLLPALDLHSRLVHIQVLYTGHSFPPELIQFFSNRLKDLTGHVEWTDLMVVFFLFVFHNQDALKINAVG